MYHFKDVDLQITSSGEWANEVTIKYNYNFQENTYKASITKHNPISKLYFGTVSKTIEAMYLQHIRDAERLCDRLLRTASYPVIELSFVHNLSSFIVDVGDTVLITHRLINGSKEAMIVSKQIRDAEIHYKAILLYDINTIELVNISHTQTQGRGDLFTIRYENGIATLTIYADVTGNPPVEGAEVTINKQTKITDKNGQVRFDLPPGTYTAYIRASGYEDLKFTFKL